MAFRSDLEAAAQRADAAEAEVARLRGELDEQKLRMERVADVESQLEAARAQIRENRAPDGRTGRVALLVALGALVGGAATFWVTEARMRGVRAEALAEQERVEAARHDAEEAALDARRALEVMNSSNEAGASGLDAERRELREILRGLTAVSLSPDSVPTIDHPLDFGRVLDIQGEAPASSGEACEFVVLPETVDCVGEIRCGGNRVHPFGCGAPPTTHVHGDGFTLEITDRVRDWRLRMTTAVALPPPSPGLPPEADAVRPMLERTRGGRR